MRDDITLGEVKARCTELTAKYGEACCNNCEYGELGCCDPPDQWQVEAGKERCAQPNWEEMFHQSEKSCQQMYMKLEDMSRKADDLYRENLRLRTIVSTVETMIGRKFDVC